MRISFLIRGLIPLILLCCPPVPAQEEQPQYPLTEKVYQSLSSVGGMMESKDYLQAENTLTSLMNTDVNPYELALIHQTLGYVYHAQERYEEANAAFNKSLAGNLLPAEVTHELHYLIAQLLTQQEKYQEALSHLLEWFQAGQEPKAEAHLLAATLYYQLQDYRNLIPHMQEAIRKSPDPEASWYELLLTAYYHAGDYLSAASLLEQMIGLYPGNREYWLQLAGMYQRTGQPEKTMTILELALRRDLLDAEGILQLARLYLSEELPYRAATLLQKKISEGVVSGERENLELLADSWLLARENDQAAKMFMQLAEMTRDPEIYYKLGHIYFTQEKWEAAGKALESAVSNGNLPDKPGAYLLLGISAYHNNENSRAAQALNRALRHDRTKQQAEWWLNKLERRR
jgi:Uncharacterized enzyme of heme biosynthesis